MQTREAHGYPSHRNLGSGPFLHAPGFDSYCYRSQGQSGMLAKDKSQLPAHSPQASSLSSQDFYFPIVKVRVDKVSCHRSFCGSNRSERHLESLWEYSKCPSNISHHHHHQCCLRHRHRHRHHHPCSNLWGNRKQLLSAAPTWW